MPVHSLSPSFVKKEDTYSVPRNLKAALLFSAPRITLVAV